MVMITIVMIIKDDVSDSVDDCGADDNLQY